MNDAIHGNPDTEKEEQTPRVTNSKARKPAAWFIALLSVLVVGIVLSVFGILFNRDLVNVVDEQLGLLRHNRFTQAYYESTSKVFQQNTSLENFKAFLSMYKVLSDNKSFIYEGQSKEGDIGKVQGELISNGLIEMNVEYQLVKEDDMWKIQSIRLKELPNSDPANSVTQALTKRVHEQLKAMQQDEILDAYYGFFTKEFQKETPYPTFQEYVSSHPILTSYKNVEFKKREIDDGIGRVDVVLGSEKGNYVLEYLLKKENNEWKIWNLRLVLPLEESAKKALTDPDTLSMPVREWLDDILQNKLQKAYFNTSKEFQDTTSLSAFENFIHSYPVLSHRDLTDIKSGKIENGVGKLLVNLHDDNGLMVIEFKLGYDEGFWKIWGIQVLEHPEQIDTESQKEESQANNHHSLAEELMEVVQGQLRALKHHDFTAAYHQYTSKEYQKKLPLGDFAAMVESNPIYIHGRNAEFDRMDQKGNKLTLKGFLVTFDYKTYPIKYELVRESGEWKINQFSVLDSEEPIVETDVHLKGSPVIDVPFTEIKKITVGDQVDHSGIIKTPRVVIDSDSNLLFFNVKIEDGIVDSLVTLFLTHVDSGTVAPPLSTKLIYGGDTTISFSYAAPPGGWPVGNYVVKVLSSTGEEHIQGFQLRKGEKKYY